MQATSIFLLSIALAASLAVTGCKEDEPEIVERVRAIKTYTVTEVASGQTRKFAGQVYATDSSTLSFQVSGNVDEMRVNQGDLVEKDQVLAVIDNRPYELDVESAQADLEKSRANLTRAQQEYERQDALFKKGWIAEARLEVFQAELDTSESELDFTTSRLNLAKRDLRLTELIAPFAGTISRKRVDAFTEVRTGQPIYDIEASGALEVRFDIPETVISRISLGMPVTVTFPTAQVSILQARITEVGSTAQTANAFPVKAGLSDPPANIRTGMTITASLLLKDEGEKSGYLVPLAAIAPADVPREGYVFLYDDETKSVKRTLVKSKGATDNFVHIYEGIEAGDIVAVAGVTFLNDGQSVKLMDQQNLDALSTPVATQ